MRKLSLLVGLVFMLALTARAQTPKAEIFGGYSYLRVNPNAGPGANLNGWELSVNVKPASWWGIMGDFDGHYGSPFGPSAHEHSFLFGPQINLPTPVISPFVHALFGVTKTNIAGATDTAFGSAFGGGFDFKAGSHFAWRLIQVDDLLTHFSGNNQNNLRVSTGIVFRF